MENWRLGELKKLLEENDKDEFVRYAIAQEYLKADEYQKAIEAFEILKDMNPNYIGLYYHLGGAQAEIEDFSGALNTYNTGIYIAQSLNDQHALAELMNAKTNLELEL